MNNRNIYLASKPRYEILDGLRGVAAMLVVAYHLFETYYHGRPNQPINHGYLAVDFFFVLSGYVIGYAYDDRWDKMSTWAFFKRRLIRLHPMVIFSTLFGALLFYYGDCPDFPLIKETSPWLVLLVMFWCFTMIPLPNTMDIRGWAETNPLNGPAWSLQWEYIANILYALVIRRLSKVALAVCVAVFSIFTIILCLNIDVTGFLEARNWASYTVVGGWSTTPDQLQVGLTRLLYPFFCGLLISRLFNSGSKFFTLHSSLFTLRHGFWWCSLLILVLLCMPWMGMGTEGEARWTNGLYEMLCILIVFPLIVSIGAGSSVKGGKSEAINKSPIKREESDARICSSKREVTRPLVKFLGEISYPIYITHYPLIYMQMSWARSHANAPLAQHIFVSISIFLFSVFVAYAAYKLYDQPVREWLKNKLFKQSVK